MFTPSLIQLVIIATILFILQFFIIAAVISGIKKVFGQDKVVSLQESYDSMPTDMKARLIELLMLTSPKEIAVYKTEVRVYGVISSILMLLAVILAMKTGIELALISLDKDVPTTSISISFADLINSSFAITMVFCFGAVVFLILAIKAQRNKQALLFIQENKPTKSAT